jgi:hypothetical protein
MMSRVALAMRGGFSVSTAPRHQADECEKQSAEAGAARYGAAADAGFLVYCIHKNLVG